MFPLVVTDVHISAISGVNTPYARFGASPVLPVIASTACRTDEGVVDESFDQACMQANMIMVLFRFSVLFPVPVVAVSGSVIYPKIFPWRSVW